VRLLLSLLAVRRTRLKELAGEGKAAAKRAHACATPGLPRRARKTLGIVTLEDVLESLMGDVREAPGGGSPPC
jgi:CBS domain containing-hemolysin-like protein